MPLPLADKRDGVRECLGGTGR